MSVRPATHAGSWFEDDKTLLSRQIQTLVAESKKQNPEFPVPGARVLVGPHAGYTYCGSILAQAYSAWDTSKVKRVFILGPSHCYAFYGAALTTFSEYQTPLGNIPVDIKVVKKLKQSAGSLFQDFPRHYDMKEHSVEMHLPFLYKASEGSPNGVPHIVPIIVCVTTREEEKAIADLLAPYVHDEENAFIISSDFCHWGKSFRYTAYTPDVTDLTSATTGLPFDQNPNDPDIVEQYDWDQLRNTELVDLTSLNSKLELKKGVTVADSIEFLDRQGLAVLSQGDPEQWDEYITSTKNTICGERPLSVLLYTLFKTKNDNKKKTLNGKAKVSNGTMNGNGRLKENGVSDGDESHWGVLKWIGYKQSQRAKSLKDTSVSYASGFAVI